MDKKIALRVSVALSSVGVLFSGYLALFGATTGECPISAPCPTFLGVPACWYGLAVFALLLLVSRRALRRPASWIRARKRLVALSFVGTVFAGQYVGSEPSALPSCVFGLIIFLGILLTTLFAEHDEPEA